MVTGIDKAAISAAAKVVQYQKYTVQPTGIYKRINNFFAVDPNRSTGVPLNPQFRNPTPGGNDPKEYTDPVTIPAADLAENPYWKRDVRRSYPRLSVVKQPDVVALLTVGSAKSPKDDVLRIGEAGSKQLVEVREEGEKTGLSAFLEKNQKAGSSVLGPGGLPPLPTSRYPVGPKRYEMLPDQSYENNDAGLDLPAALLVQPKTVLLLTLFPTDLADLNSSPSKQTTKASSMRPHLTRAYYMAPNSARIRPEACGSANDQNLVCVICGIALPERRKHDISGQGIGTCDGYAVRMWLTSCGHLTCSEHLEGGGAPFHAANELPQASCPLCSSVNLDQSLKELYWVHGFAHGQHDKRVPASLLGLNPKLPGRSRPKRPMHSDQSSPRKSRRNDITDSPGVWVPLSQAGPLLSNPYSTPRNRVQSLAEDEEFYEIDSRHDGCDQCQFAAPQVLSRASSDHGRRATQEDQNYVGHGVSGHRLDTQAQPFSSAYFRQAQDHGMTVPQHHMHSQMPWPNLYTRPGWQQVEQIGLDEDSISQSNQFPGPPWGSQKYTGMSAFTSHDTAGHHADTPRHANLWPRSFRDDLEASRFPLRAAKNYSSARQPWQRSMRNLPPTNTSTTTTWKPNKDRRLLGIFRGMRQSAGTPSVAAQPWLLQGGLVNVPAQAQPRYSTTRR